MSVQIKPGAIIRRGAANIPAETMKFLVENEAEVQKLISDIDARSEAFKELQRSTAAASVELEKTEMDLAERENALALGLVELAAARTTNKVAHDSNMEALSRRTREVLQREGDAKERDEALDNSSTEIERLGRERETEFAERERVVEELEDHANKRQEIVAGDDTELDRKILKTKTILGKVHALVANLPSGA